MSAPALLKEQGWRRDSASPLMAKSDIRYAAQHANPIVSLSQHLTRHPGGLEAPLRRLKSTKQLNVRAIGNASSRRDARTVGNGSIPQYSFNAFEQARATMT